MSKEAIGLSSVIAVFVLITLATRSWRILEPAGVLDVRHMQAPLQDAQLRELGERLAAKYPGYHNMGITPIAMNAYMPFERSAAELSCEGSGGGEEGGRQMVVLVTGAAGFIGAAAAMQLWSLGYGVLGVDNFNDYYPVSLKRARQAQLLSAGVYTVDGDLNDQSLLHELFQLCTFSHVLHLAAQAGVRYAAQNPYSYVHSNIGGHVTLLEALRAAEPMPALVYASSSSVYGLNTKQPFSEADRVDQPASLYASTKRADELIAHTYHNIYSMSVTGLRFFTVYGPWGRPDMAAYKFAKSIMMGGNITIFQGPENSELSRDFTFIDDIVGGILAALKAAPRSVPGKAHNKIYNVGNTQPHTVSEMVDLLEKHLRRPAQRLKIPVPPTGDVLATFANITEARKDLGYNPTVSLDEGVRRFCEWFHSYYALDEGGADGPYADDWSYNPL